jgi:two-component system, sensor histidine kinase PdtaS
MTKTKAGSGARVPPRGKNRRSDDASLRELSHRVSNHLQSLISYVSIRRRAASSTDTKDALGDVLKQVATMAVIHRYLGPSIRDDIVDAGALLREITRQLTTMRTDATRISIDVDAPRVEVSSSLATALGLIAAELVWHAYKQGLSGDGAAIQRRLSLDGGPMIRLELGAGAACAEADDPHGLKLVRHLAEALGGSVESIAGAVRVLIPSAQD